MVQPPCLMSWLLVWLSVERSGWWDQHCSWTTSWTLCCAGEDWGCRVQLHSIKLLAMQSSATTREPAASLAPSSATYGLPMECRPGRHLKCVTVCTVSCLLTVCARACVAPCSRISRRVMAEQHLHIANARPGYIGSIATALDVADAVQFAGQRAVQVKGMRGIAGRGVSCPN